MLRSRVFMRNSSLKEVSRKSSTHRNAHTGQERYNMNCILTGIVSLNLIFYWTFNLILNFLKDKVINKGFITKGNLPLR